MSIIEEIFDAAYERAREFGRDSKHAIKQWPLTADQWSQLLREYHPVLGEWDQGMTALSLFCQAQPETPIRVFKGP